MTIIKHLIAATTVAITTAGAAAASTLTPADPTLSADTTALYILDLGVSSDIEINPFFDQLSNLSASGIVAPAGLTLELLISANLADPSQSFGDFTFFDGLDTFLSGELVSFMESGSSLTAEFDVTGGSVAGDFGATVLAVLDVGAGLGVPTSLAGVLPTSVTFSAVQAPTPPTNVIPLPAGVWLLISGLGGLALVRRRSA